MGNRTVHCMFSKLLGHTGVTWDPNTNKVNAAEKINKSDYKIFKREVCKHYHTLGEIFSGTTAIGGLGNASTQRLAISEEERQLEDDFLNRGMHVHVENDDDVMRFQILVGVRKLVHQANADVKNLRSVKVTNSRLAWHSGHLLLV
ncbi:Myb/SANT-like DNA-binding domain-containing protein [Forsythia ovata]|uniref:Myb/SANT-like DNA-binding domain-containing protein n=1 Tax=Forsythia ovata TaxID=205694 RepID=A0ABD1SQ08_9LAMI